MPKINTQKPIELDDGTPVTFIGTDKDGDLIIKLPAGKDPFRSPLGEARKLYPQLSFDGAAGYNTYYYTPEGEFRGYEGNPDFYHLRSVPDAPVIDWSKPIELDDGTPARVIAGPDEDGDYEVESPKRRRDQPASTATDTWYYNAGGRFVGCEYSPAYYTIRNSAEQPAGLKPGRIEVSRPSLLGWTLPCGAEVIEEEMKYGSPNAHENPYLSVSFDKDPRHIRGGFSERFGWHFTPTGEHHYGAFSNLTPPVPTPTAPPAFAPEKPALFTYGIDYRLDRSGYVLVNTPADEWVRLGPTRSRLFLGILSLLREVDLEVSAGRAPAALKAVAEIGTRNLLSDLTRETRAVQRDTMASLFETLQALLASLGDPEGKTEWKRAA